MARKPGHRGERGISRKTIARGMPGDGGVTVVTTLVCSFHSACEAAGASRAPGIPCALFGANDLHNSDAVRRGMVETRNVIARSVSDEAIHSFFASEMDCFASLAMTDDSWLSEI